MKNPLLLHLPEASPQDVSEKIAFYPPIYISERNLPPHVRVHCVERLRGLIQPHSQHINLINVLSGLIKNGYSHRNPLSREFILRNRCGDILRKDKFNNHLGLKAALVGITGTGKSIAVERVLKIMYPQVIYHEQGIAFEQLLWLKIDCPTIPSIKMLCAAILSELDRRLNTSYLDLFVWKNEKDLMTQVAKLLWLQGLGVLVVDDIQNVVAKGHSVKQTVFEFLEDLSQVVGIPVLVIGTPNVTPVLPIGFLDNVIKWNPLIFNHDWNKLVRRMFNYQWTSELTELSANLSVKLYQESLGIVDIAVKLYISSQQLSVNGGFSRITGDIISIVCNEKYNLIRPMMNAMRTGLKIEMNKYQDLTG